MRAMNVPEPASRPLLWSYLGRVPYAEAVELQHAVRDAVRRGEGPDRFLLLEHPHVYTLGRNADRSDVLREGVEGVEVIECDRGGQVTYHGPGQLVGYPVVNLSPDRRDIRRYVRDLQEALIRTLADYGIEGRPGEEAAFIGVWVGAGKIASIGVHLSHWITTHGFALNVSTDLSYFSGIIPCGLRQVEMTSMERLTGKAPALPEVAAACARHLAEILGREPVSDPYPDWAPCLIASTSA
jgi:lipoyl(octanoyl) transferase